MAQKTNQRNKGYTIIETMIAISLFLVVIMAGMGSLLNANVLHQKSRDMRSIIDNLNFIMEDIGRNLRTGYSYHCLTGNDNLANSSTPLSCLSGWGIAFEAAGGSSATNNDQWVYYIDNGKIWKSTDNGTTSFIQLNPAEVFIDSISSFSVLGAEGVAINQQQPFVTIKLVGRITYKPGTSSSVVTPFSLQTSISQRLVDI